MPDKVKENTQDDVRELLREFEENPFDPAKKTPEDIMHIFYRTNVPIVPVISKRNMLIGIITKEAITSEMSDLDRFNNVKIDRFVEKIACKMTLDEIIPYLSTHKEFIAINLFGEIQGNWSRLELLAACENNKATERVVKTEINRQKEEQALEWMIYLILEHIPRAVYAINKMGKTIFYNSYFEEMFLANMRCEEVDLKLLEKSINNHKKNEFFYKNNQHEMYFYNKDIKFYYEKIPMISNEKEVGYLIYCLSNQESGFSMLDIDENLSLHDNMNNIERSILIEAIKKYDNDLDKVVKALKLQKKTLLKKIQNHNINLKT